MKTQRLNDEDRRQWVENDEGLYNWQRGSGLGMRAFIRANRAELDRAIRGAIERPPAERTRAEYAEHIGNCGRAPKYGEPGFYRPTY